MDERSAKWQELKSSLTYCDRITVLHPRTGRETYAIFHDLEVLDGVERFKCMVKKSRSWDYFEAHLPLESFVKIVKKMDWSGLKFYDIETHLPIVTVNRQ